FFREGGGWTLLQVIPSRRYRRADNLGFVAATRENLPHQLTDTFVATLMEHQNGWSGPAQRAAQEARGPKPRDLLQARHQIVAIRLMQPVFERRWKDIPGAR